MLSQGNERERMALRVWLLVCAGEMRWLLSCLASRPEKRKKKTPSLQGAVVLASIGEEKKIQREPGAGQKKNKNQKGTMGADRSV